MLAIPPVVLTSSVVTVWLPTVWRSEVTSATPQRCQSSSSSSSIFSASLVGSFQGRRRTTVGRPLIRLASMSPVRSRYSTARERALWSTPASRSRPRGSLTQVRFPIRLQQYGEPDHYRLTIGAGVHGDKPVPGDGAQHECAVLGIEPLRLPLSGASHQLGGPLGRCDEVFPTELGLGHGHPSLPQVAILTGPLSRERKRGPIFP